MKNLLKILSLMGILPVAACAQTSAQPPAQTPPAQTPSAQTPPANMPMGSHGGMMGNPPMSGGSMNHMPMGSSGSPMMGSSGGMMMGSSGGMMSPDRMMNCGNPGEQCQNMQGGPVAPSEKK